MSIIALGEVAGRFVNKVLVTGGNCGVGRAAALAFASEGAWVTIAARRADPAESVVQEIQSVGGEASFNVSGLAEELGVNKSTASRVAASLEANGLVEAIDDRATIRPSSWSPPASA